MKLSITLDTLTARILNLSSDSQSRIEPVPFYSWWDAIDRRADSAVAPALRKNLCKFKNCDKSDILERLKNNRSNFLQYTTDTVICQGSLDISLPEWSAAEWNQADIRRLSRACRGT